MWPKDGISFIGWGLTACPSEKFEAMWARRPSGRRLVGGIESTGPYWMPLAHWLRQQPGVAVVLVNPLHTHKLKEVDDHTPSKHDAKDAEIIARAVADGRYRHGRPREGVWSELTTLSVGSGRRPWSPPTVTPSGYPGTRVPEPS